MENLIQQLQVALTELVQERDTLKRELEEHVQQAKRDAVAPSDGTEESFIKGFREGVRQIESRLFNIGCVNHHVNLNIYESQNCLDFEIRGDYDTELDVSELIGDYGDFNFSDDEIRESLNESKEE